jgi:antirestriction protein ArdC
MNFDEPWDPREKLASDIAAAERCIQLHAQRDAWLAEYAKAWLRELEAESRAQPPAPDSRCR